jgi:hypothetical protein
VLCWLALLLVRVAEVSCGDSWPHLRRELEKIKLGSFAGSASSFRQRSETAASQRAILAKLGLAEPPRLQGSRPPPQPPKARQTLSGYRCTRRCRVRTRLFSAQAPRFADYRVRQLRTAR